MLKKLVILLLCVLALSSCSIKVDLDKIEESEDTYFTPTEDTVECDEKTVVKINPKSSGFFHDGNWYVPYEMVMIRQDYIQGEEIELTQEVNSLFANNRNGCMIEGDIVEGSNLGFPEHAKVIKTADDKFYMCDTDGICAEYIKYDGVNRELKLPDLRLLLKDMDYMLFYDAETTYSVLYKVGDIENDLYVMPFDDFKILQLITKTDPEKVYFYRYAFIENTNFFAIYDDYAGKAFKVYFNQEDLGTVDAVTGEPVEVHE